MSVGQHPVFAQSGQCGGRSLRQPSFSFHAGFLDTANDSNDRAQYGGFLKKLTSVAFLKNLAVMLN